MSLSPVSFSTVLAGQFEHRITKRPFDYVMVKDFPDLHPWDEADADGFNVVVFVGPSANETRRAKLLLTVAHIAVHTDSRGFPVLESWPITNVWSAK